MAKYTIEDTTLTNIADAIREKGNTTETLTPTQMPDAINAIEAGSGGGDGFLYTKLNTGSTFTASPSLTYTDTVCESCGLWYYGINAQGSAQSATAWRWRKKSKSDIWPMVYYAGSGLRANETYRFVCYVWCSPGKTVEWASNNIYFNENYKTTHNLKPITENRQRIDLTFKYVKSSSTYEPVLHIYPKFADTDEDTQLFMSAPIFFRADAATGSYEFPY